jgi:hypothetical protein
MSKQTSREITVVLMSLVAFLVPVVLGILDHLSASQIGLIVLAFVLGLAAESLAHHQKEHAE